MNLITRHETRRHCLQIFTGHRNCFLKDFFCYKVETRLLLHKLQSMAEKYLKMV